MLVYVSLKKSFFKILSQGFFGPHNYKICDNFPGGGSYTGACCSNSIVSAMGIISGASIVRMCLLYQILRNVVILTSVFVDNCRPVKTV